MNNLKYVTQLMSMFTLSAWMEGHVRPDEIVRPYEIEKTNENKSMETFQCKSESNHFIKQTDIEPANLVEYYRFFTNAKPLTSHEKYILSLYEILEQQNLLPAGLTNIDQIENYVNKHLLGETNSNETVSDNFEIAADNSAKTVSSETKVFCDQYFEELTCQEQLSVTMKDIPTLESPVEGPKKQLLLLRHKDPAVRKIVKRDVKTIRKPKDKTNDNTKRVAAPFITIQPNFTIDMTHYVRYSEHSVSLADESKYKINFDGFKLWIDRALSNSKIQLIQCSVRRKAKNFCVSTHYFYKTTAININVMICSELKFKKKPKWKKGYKETSVDIHEINGSFPNVSLCLLNGRLDFDSLIIVSSSDGSTQTPIFPLRSATSLSVSCSSVLYNLYENRTKNKITNETRDSYYRILYARNIFMLFRMLSRAIE